MNLHERFLRFARVHGAPAETAERWWSVLAARYGEPHRHYHTLAHVEHLLDLLPHADETVLAAAWFHDAVYDGAENEERSALLAREALEELGFDREAIAVVERMIRATKTHDPDALPPAALAFLDADLAILGSDPERYAEYVAQVRREYAHVPDAAFRAGRNAILRAFLERPRIYFTEEFRARFEDAARANLQREVSEPVGAKTSAV